MPYIASGPEAEACLRWPLSIRRPTVNSPIKEGHVPLMLINVAPAACIFNHLGKTVHLTTSCLRLKRGATKEMWQRRV